MNSSEQDACSGALTEIVAVLREVFSAVEQEAHGVEITRKGVRHKEQLQSRGQAQANQTSSEVLWCSPRHTHRCARSSLLLTVETHHQPPRKKPDLTKYVSPTAHDQQPTHRI